MRHGRPPLYKWALGIGGFVVVTVVIPLVVQIFYDDWFKAHAPALASFYSGHWTPSIITVSALVIIAILLIWPNLLAGLTDPGDPNETGNHTIYSRTTYVFNGPITLSDLLNIVEGAADEALDDDVPNVPPGEVLD